MGARRRVYPARNDSASGESEYESILVQFIVKSWERPRNDAEYTQVHVRKLVVFGLL